MTTGNAWPALDAAWRPHEAQVLAALLRASRLTVVYGNSSAATTLLLSSGVLPLLCSEPAPREVVVALSDWREAPLQALQAGLREAVQAGGMSADISDDAPLADTLAALHERLGARFLFVFDRFEDFLEAPRDREDVLAFSHAFVDAANRSGLAASFLLAVHEEAKPLLKRLCRRIPGLAQHGVRLAVRDDGSLELLPVLEQDRDLRAGPADGAPPHPSMRTDQVYTSIEGWLAKTADAHREAPWQPPPGEPVPESQEPVEEVTLPPRCSDDAAQQAAPAPIAPVLQVPRPAAPAPVPRSAWRGRAIAAAAVLPLLLGAWLLGGRWSQPPAAAGAPPAKRFVLGTDADAGTEARIAGELARQLPVSSGIELGTAPASGGVSLAILRTDALEAARGSAALRIVTPLFTEELHVIVRADSPLKTVQQLKGRRINVGPAASARAQSAARLYEALFASRLPASTAAALPQQAAVRELLAGKLDALMVIDAQPSAWLAAQDEQTLRAIRLLKVDVPAARRRALHGWLPAVVNGETPTLAQMSYLVTNAAEDEAEPDAIARLAIALCRALPALRRDGHPKWLEVQPAAPDGGWPHSASALHGFRTCAAAG